MPFELILGRRGPQRSAIGFANSTNSRTGELLTYSGDGHLITFAPTGTGKTSGPVICNALRHRGQLIVIDMKGEIYAATAEARRAMGQQVHVLDLRDDGHPGSLNPLDLIMRSGTDSAAVARSFASELIERGTGERERFWNDWSETMIAGVATWLLADCPAEQRKLSAVYDLLTSDDVDYRIAKLLDENDSCDTGLRGRFSFHICNCLNVKPGQVCWARPSLMCAFSTATLRAGSPIRARSTLTR